MPAVLRMMLRPPSQPMRYSVRSVAPSDSATIHAAVVLREARYLAAEKEFRPELSRPAGKGALDAVLR